MGNGGDIGLRHLKALSVLLQVRSLTRAAELLDTSQPAVSKLLARLRTHFGDPLFVREGMSMLPTPRAMEIAEPLRSLLAVSDELQISEATFDPTSSQREFKVAVTDVGMAHFVPLLMRALERAGKNLRLKAIPLDRRNILGVLQGHEADIAFGEFPNVEGSVRRQNIYVDPFVSVARRGHPRTKSLTDAKSFLRERHILVTASHTGHAAHESLEKALLAKLDESNVSVRVPSFVAAALVASHTDAIGTVPSRLAERLARDLPLQTIKPPIPLPRIEVGQIWHERYDRDSAHRWLRSTIFGLFRRPYQAKRDAR